MARTPYVYEDFACACKFGDADFVRTMLRKSPKAAQDWRPIIEASYIGSAPIVEMLIKHGADVNAISSNEHNRPLHRAIEKGHQNVVEVLLK